MGELSTARGKTPTPTIGLWAKALSGLAIAIVKAATGRA